MNMYLFNPLELHYDSSGCLWVKESFFYLVKQLNQIIIDVFLILLIALVRSNRQALDG